MNQSTEYTRERVRQVYQTRHACWRLCYYPPRFRMPMHRHDTAQFSVLLSGSQHENTRQGASDASHFAMQLRPAEFEHATRFGDQGAILLSINLFDGISMPGVSQPMRQDSAEPLRLEWHALIAALTGKEEIQEPLVSELTHDLLAAMCDAPVFGRRKSSVPVWLNRAREMLIETDHDSLAIAREVGVHRVHLARSFRRFFGISVTRFRVRNRLACATRQLIDGRQAIADSAVDSGFSDQSHLTRQMRREMGLTPATLVRALSTAAN